MEPDGASLSNSLAGPALEMEGVSKRFGQDIWALREVTLQIEPGEFVAVLGVSGCGKSTLLRLLAGLQPPTSGRLRVLGKSPEEARRSRDFGIVFQDAALFPWRTVRQNIQLPGEVFGDRECQARVDQWIERVGLVGFENALPRELSGGMRSRVAIARALVFRPRVLMMDEPFGALDELTRSEMHRELLTLWEEYRPTVFFITHSVTEALFLADRVVVMTPRPGRIRAIVPSFFPRPRPVQLRHSPEFAQVSDQLLDLLMK